MDIADLTTYAKAETSDPVPEGTIVKNTHDDVEYIWSTVDDVQKWNRIHKWGRVTPDPAQPYSGDVIDVAATTSALYVLTMDGWDAYGMQLWRSTDGINWTNVSVSGSPYLENIYGGGDILFAGAFTGTSSREYGVLYDDGSNLVPCTDGANSIKGRLAGAAQTSSAYYVAAGSTVYSGSSAITLSTPASIGSAIAGIIAIPGKELAAATVNGRLYEVSGGSFTQVGGSLGGTFTGALAVFYDASQHAKLLLIGTELDSSYYTYGYRELEINGSGSLVAGFHEPGGSDSSIANQPRYRSSLGRRVIQSIIQTPKIIDDNQTLFTSTQKNGLWRYYRSKEEWNADDNSGS
jgi:hypothetical protein